MAPNNPIQIMTSRPTQADVELVKHDLKVSGYRPIELIVDQYREECLNTPDEDDKYTETVREFIAAVIPYAWRIESICLRLRTVAPIDELVMIPAEQLQQVEKATFDLTWRQEVTQGIWRNFLQSPAIRSVKFYSGSPATFPHIPSLSRLHELEFASSKPISEVLCCLQNAPNLHTLRTYWISEDDGDLAKSGVLVELPHLQILNVRAVKPWLLTNRLGHLSSLRSLEILQDLPSDSGLVLQSVCDLLERSTGCQLESLHLIFQNLKDDDVICTIMDHALSACSNLTELILEVSFSHGYMTEAIVAKLTATGNEAIFPKLRVLSLGYCKLEDGYIYEMITSRQSSQSPLELLTLQLDKSCSERYRAELGRVLTDTGLNVVPSFI
ncbi:hypothetical protein BDN72DRAFT_906338 [Pluteus cervinus]|uniref:Uncharacterized protein n=1 Tax=Pluteus cervinus TaxID=181527 RepID=A0ACD2ZZM7_9AGAR|nr:hypothetical protein BDN72DRAFT_906338 [Pluteus cervinus]